MSDTHTTRSQYLSRNIDGQSRLPGVELSGAASARRILNATNTTAVPSAATAGFDISGAEKLYIKLKATTNNATVVLWEWDATSSEWAKNDTLGTVSLTAGQPTTLVGAEVDGSHRAYLQVATAVGAGQFDGWVRIILRQRG